MTITFLGTGASQGVPVIACSCSTCQSPDSKDKRLRSSIHFTDRSKSILIDSGPDLRQQLLRAKIEQLDALLLTHEHRDHTGGLGDMRSIIYRQEKSMPLYAGARVVAHLQREFTYLFTKTSCQEIPNFRVHIIEHDTFEVEGLTVAPIRVHHNTLPIWGFRIGELAYITDAKVITEEEVDKIRGITVLIVNALQREPHPAHFNLQEALVFAQKVGAQVTYLTHISHLLGCHQEVSKKLPSNIHLAHDGLQFSV